MKGFRVGGKIIDSLNCRLTSTHPLGGDEVAPGTASDTLSFMEDQGLSTVSTEPPITGTAEAGRLAGCGNRHGQASNIILLQ